MTGPRLTEQLSLAFTPVDPPVPIICETTSLLSLV